MNKWKNVKEKWKWPLLGITLIMAGYMAWGLFTVSYKAESLAWLAFGITVIVMGCYAWISYGCMKTEISAQNCRQWRTVSIIVGACSTTLLIKGGTVPWDKKEFLAFFVEVLWCIISLGSFFCLTDRQSFNFSKLKRNIRENIGIVLLLAITLVLCIDPDAFQYRWDGILYYLTCKNLSLQSISSLAIYGHIAQTFGAFAQIGNIIFKDTGIALYVMNVASMVVGIIYFYKIVKYCLPGKTQWNYVLLTALYAWSPYLLGMVSYYNLDFICQCLLTPVIYYLIQKKWILLTFFSLLFCFTKEPAILVYGALCVGTVLIDILDNKEFTLWKRIIRCFGKPQYYIMAMPGILWLVTYKMLGPWSAGNGGVEFDVLYVIEKLKNLYILNFNWAFTLVVVTGMVVVIGKRDRQTGKLIIPLACAQMIFTAFSCVFKTVNHPRYNDTNQVTLYLMAIILICTYMKAVVYNIWATLMGLLLLGASFYTIDPLSLFVYKTYNIGSAIMITTGDNPLGDYMIYNRQMLGMERALGYAIEELIQDNVNICFPAINDNPYFFDGMCEVNRVLGCRIDTEYWDTERNSRVPEEREHTIEFKVCQISDQMDAAIWGLLPDNETYLIYMDCAGRSCYEKMKEFYSIVQEEEYNYKGWTVHRAGFQRVE